MRAYRIRAPASAVVESSEISVAKAEFCAVEVARLARRAVERVAEAYPVHDVAHLHRSVRIGRRVRQMVKVANRTHRVRLVRGNEVCRADCSLERTSLAGQLGVFDKPFVAVQDFSGLRPFHRIGMPLVERFAGKGACYQVRRGVVLAVPVGDDRLDPRHVGVRRPAALQYHKRLEKRTRGDAVERASLAQGKIHLGEHRKELIQRLLRRVEKPCLPRNLVSLDKTPNRVLAPPDVPGIDDGLGILVRSKISVGTHEAVDKAI